MNRRLFFKMAAALGCGGLWEPDQTGASATALRTERIRGLEGLAVTGRLDKRLVATSAVIVHYLDEPGEWYMVDHGGLFWKAERQTGRDWRVDVSVLARQAYVDGGYCMRWVNPSDRLRHLLGEQGVNLQLETEDGLSVPSLIGETEISDPLKALRILDTVVIHSTPQELWLDPGPDEYHESVVACVPEPPTIWLPGNEDDLTSGF